MTDGIGPILARRIIDAAGGDVRAACEAPVSLLRTVDGIGLAKATKIAGALQFAGREINRELDRAGQLGVTILCPDDAEYPTLLRTIPDPPLVLYVRGTFEPRDLNGLAIVGSRKCSYYGREQAERFGALLAAAGFCVISGGARGIDSAAHRGALSHPQGRTIAVLGSGVDVPYPAENASLFDLIATRGAVVSEYPLGTPPAKENFPRRNRVVSGMSRGVLVVEADERSGALITARQAGEDHGRVVFALPGRVDNPMSAGPHRLIRDGAVLVTKLEDIFEGLGALSGEIDSAPLFAAPDEIESSAEPVHPSAKPQAIEPLNGASIGLTERQRLILSHLSNEPLHLDGIIERTELAAPTVMQELTFLTLKGAVKRVDGHTYVRSRGAGASS